MNIYPESFFIALAGGLFATLLMIILEIPAWRKWGLIGVLEWHENQALSTKFFKLSDNHMHTKGIFLLHFVNGGLGGIGFLLVLLIFPFTVANMFFSGIVYGVFLWVVTLIPIHKPITGISPWKHPNGMMPTVLSLIGHLVYGVAIGLYVDMVF